MDACRRNHRVDVRLRTVYHDEIDADESDTLMSNLSAGGCFIRTTRMLPPGAPIRVKFELPGRTDPVNATGRVRWVEESDDPEERGMGVQFQDIEEADLLALKEFIAGKLETELLW